MASLHAPYLYDGEAGTAIQNLKFRRITSLATPMSEIMWEYAQKHLDGKYDVIIPVPIARTRKSERGFNQAELLCSAFPPALVRPGYLKRTRYTKPQVNLDRKARLTNLQGAFITVDLPLGAKVLLIDDVITTGGTAIACGEALVAGEAGEVHLLTFASQPLS
ncbi:MAG: ComF family protein [Fimbriimonadaceae bacterium]|nr:ComF family protein [Fimbriimonadaceae bacterium]